MKDPVIGTLKKVLDAVAAVLIGGMSLLFLRYLWDFPVALAAVAGGCAWAMYWHIRERQRRAREGYWVQVAWHPDFMEIGYFEVGRTEGLILAGEKVVEIPSEELWDARAVAWAVGRRNEIIGRIRRLKPRLRLRVSE